MKNAVIRDFIRKIPNYGIFISGPDKSLVEHQGRLRRVLQARSYWILLSFPTLMAKILNATCPTLWLPVLSLQQIRYADT